MASTANREGSAATVVDDAAAIDPVPQVGSRRSTGVSVDSKSESAKRCLTKKVAMPRLLPRLLSRSG